MVRIGTGSDGVIQFQNDDAGYLEWLAAHPLGFVVNSDRSPKPTYLVLHRSSCKAINTPDRSNWTTTGYIKTCSEGVAALSAWARSAVGGSLSACSLCKPEIDRASMSATVVTTAAAVEAAAPQQRRVYQPPVPISQIRRHVPSTISTGCPELDLVWKRFAQHIVTSPILIPDTEDDLNWHAFLGHSLDMQGFRAAEFVGVDSLTKPAPGFVPLKTRGIGVFELAQLWEIDEIRSFLLSGTKNQPLQATLDLLRLKGGATGKGLAETLERFPYRKFHWVVRAYLQNCAALKAHDYSFRGWLQTECELLGASLFPPTDFRAKTQPRSTSLELSLRQRLEQAFYQVGPALAAYMLCDWQLWLWCEGRTELFANFKLDSFHEEFVRRFGRGIIPPDEQGFVRWWLGLYPDLPPRLANECIWLGLEHKVV